MPLNHPEAGWSRGWDGVLGVIQGPGNPGPPGAWGEGAVGRGAGGGGRGGRRGAHAAEGVGHLLVQVSAFHPPLHPAASSGREARAPRGGRDLGGGGAGCVRTPSRESSGVGWVRATGRGPSPASGSDGKTSPTHSGDGGVSFAEL